MPARFRVATPDDAGAILAIYAPYCSSTQVSFEIVAPSEPQMRDRIASVSGNYPWLIGELDGKVAGYVYATQHRERAAYRWSVDVAVYVAEAHQRRKLGRALYSSLLSILRQQGFFQAYASITLPNPASVGLHESVGFEQVAEFQKVGYKMGRWLDVGWWRRQLQPATENPPDPRAFSTICDHAAVAAALDEGARAVTAR